MKFLNTILNKIADILSNIERLDAFGKLITLGLIGLSVYYLNTCGNQELENLQVEVRQTKETAKILKDSVSTLKNEVNEKEIVITELTIRVSKKQQARVVLVEKQTTLDSLLAVEKDTTAIVALQDSTIDNLKNQLVIVDQIIADQTSIIEQRDQQLNMLQTSLQLQENRANILEAQLDDVMKQHTKEKKFLGFISKPSRKTALLVGTAVGTLTGFVIAK